MTVVVDTYDALPCQTSIFFVNGITADEYDFGNMNFDYSDVDLGCTGVQFIPKKSTPEVLEKYKITKADYKDICEILMKKLDVGDCGWCV